MGKIVVGMDGSSVAADALRWAVVEGQLRGWRVNAVLAWTPIEQHHVEADAEFVSGYGESDAMGALEAYATAAIGPESVATIHLETVCDRPATAVIDASVDASLLVVGSRGHGGIRGALMGSVSQQCLHFSSVPIAVVRGADTRTNVEPGKVVVGIDGSPTSRRALAWALDEARARNGYVEVVHAWLLPVAYGYPTVAVPDTRIYEESATALVAEVLESADTSGLSRPVVSTVVGGTSTAGLLQDRAADAELVVVGSRGVGGFQGMVVGSVAHHLAHHSPCTLVVIPAEH